MPDREKVIKALEDFNKNRICLPHLIPWDEIADALSLLKEQERLIEEAQCEGYNEAYRSYCVEVAEEDREPIRYRYAVEQDEQDLKDAEFDVDVAMLKEQEAVVQKTGHWIWLQFCANEGVYCSECHTKMFDRYPMKKKLSQFCGHCGAKMVDEVEGR